MEMGSSSVNKGKGTIVAALKIESRLGIFSLSCISQLTPTYK